MTKPRHLAIALVALSLVGCRAASIKPIEWNTTDGNPVFLVLMAVEPSPVYIDGGSTQYGRTDNNVARPDWDTHKQLEDLVRVALEAGGGEVNVQHVAREEIEHVEAALAEGIIPEMPGYMPEYEPRLITIRPNRDVVLQGPNVQGDEGYGLVHHCVLFVACFGRPFMNMEVNFYELSPQPRHVRELIAWHEDRGDDYLRDFEKDAFENDPTADWQRTRQFFDKYWAAFAEDISQAAGMQPTR